MCLEDPCRSNYNLCVYHIASEFRLFENTYINFTGFASISHFRKMAASMNTSTIPPSKLAHVVFRSHNLEKMRNFYLQFLGAKIAFEIPNVLAFLRYDEEHHRLGIIGMPDIGDKVKNSNGLEVSLTILGIINFFLHHMSPLCTG